VHTSPFRLRLEGSALPYHLDEALTSQLEVYTWIRREYLRVKCVRDVERLFDVAINDCRTYAYEVSVMLILQGGIVPTLSMYRVHVFLVSNILQ